MKHTNNHSTTSPRIKLVIDWFKGVKMDIPYSKWVMFSIGMYVLAAAFDKLVSAYVVLAPVIR